MYKKNVGIFSLGKMKITQLYLTCGTVIGSLIPCERRRGCPWGNGIAWDGTILTDCTSKGSLDLLCLLHYITNRLTHDFSFSRNRQDTAWKLASEVLN